MVDAPAIGLALPRFRNRPAAIGDHFANRCEVLGDGCRSWEADVEFVFVAMGQDYVGHVGRVRCLIGYVYTIRLNKAKCKYFAFIITYLNALNI